MQKAMIHDGITGNVLRITDQLVEVRSTLGGAEKFAPSDAKAVAREIARQEPSRNASDSFFICFSVEACHESNVPGTACVDLVFFVCESSAKKK